jgi:hypothetical protein
MSAFAALERAHERRDAPGALDELENLDSEGIRAPSSAGAQPREPRGLVRVARALRNLPEAYRLLRAFERFPAAHLRTNAFVVEHELWTDLSPVLLRSKLDAHALESGRRSLTCQIQDRGLAVVVADRFGDSYKPPDWAASETFWQGAQKGLVVADNQTDSYAFGDIERRMLLARFAWGQLAAPADPA